MKRIGDYNEENMIGWLKRQTPLGLLLKIVGCFIALSLALGVIGYVSGWFSEGKRVVSPANVREQWQFAYDFDESLGAIATQWCTAKAAEQTATNPDTKDQRTSQRIAVEQNYARVAAEYNGRLRDAFRAKLVKPGDVPDQAPSLQSKTQQACP